MKVVLLLSGGFDSAVAGALLKDGGHEVVALHGSQAPFAGREAELRAKAAAGKLGLGEMRVLPIGEELQRMSKAAPKLYFVLMKRLLLREAERLAAVVGAEAIATGENLGQVSSQTGTNLVVIDRAARLPVLRPLLGWDKREIIDFAKERGLFELVAGPEACDVLGPERPSTRARLTEVEAAERSLLKPGRGEESA